MIFFAREAIAQARALGLLDPAAAGSFTHPDPSRMVYGDGKVIEPLYWGKRGDTRVDKDTGEVVPVRCDPDANDHKEGGGEEVYGTKFLMVSTRSAEGRVILDARYVPFSGEGGEAGIALESFSRIASLAPGISASSGTWRFAVCTSTGS